MAIAQAQITTGAGAAELIGPRSGRRLLIIRNHDATNAAVIGGSNVTATGATGGVQLKPGDPPLVITDGGEDDASDAWYAVAALGTPIVGVVEVY